MVIKTRCQHPLNCDLLLYPVSQLSTQLGEVWKLLVRKLHSTYQPEADFVNDLCEGLTHEACVLIFHNTILSNCSSKLNTAHNKVSL